MYQGYKLAIVVPAYDDEELIAETLKGIPAEADRIYVVDDASTDATRQIIETFIDGQVCLLGNSHNRGVGAAIVTGYQKAITDGMDIIAVMAGDNQMDKKHLQALLLPILEGKADYVKGNRLSHLAHQQGMSLWRFFGNWVLTFLTKIATGYWQVRDPHNGYTAITREALKRIDLEKIYPRYGYCNDLLAKLNASGCRVVDVPMPARYGREKSKIKYSSYITTISPLLIRCLLQRLMIKYVSNHRTNLDFTIDKYRNLCDTLLRSGYSVSTVASYLENPKQAQNVLIMRHDVDRKPHCALLMAQVEHEFNIKSTYYFRFNKKVFHPRLIREIAKMEHEIGYHYEVLDKAKGNHGRAIEIFKNELDEFRKIAEVKTICMHGNPLTEWDNRDIWGKHDFNDFGLIGEAYLSFSDITYLSDTGRTWRNKYKVKDWLPSATYAKIEKAGGPAISSTDKLIELIKSVEIRLIYLLVHPERWSNSITEWTFEYLRDRIINFMKLGLQMRKHTKLLRRVH